MSKLGLVHAIACKMVEIDETNFQMLRREIRLELRQNRMRLTGEGRDRYKILARSKKSGRRPKYKALVYGTSLQSVCAKLVKTITPSDHNPTE